MEQTFTDANFDTDVLQSADAVLVDFWAPWCGPCQMMGPIIEELANENSNKKIKIGKLNVDENPSIAGKYNVMSIPTFLIFKDGKQIDQLTGGLQKEKIQELIDKHI